jgi:hypothetical protein
MRRSAGGHKTPLYTLSRPSGPDRCERTETHGRQDRVLSIFPCRFAGPEKGQLKPPPPHTHDLSTSGGDARDDPVVGRVRHLRGGYLRRALHHFRHRLQRVGRGAAGISLRVLVLIPHADGHRFRAAWDDEHNLVLAAWLFPQPGKDVFLNGLGKLRDAVGLQLQGNCASKYVNLQGCRLRGMIADNPTQFRKSVE